MAYSDLTLSERAAVIKAGVKRGYRRLDQIVDAYNQFAYENDIDEENPFNLEGEVAQDFSYYMNTEPLSVPTHVIEQEKAFNQDVYSSPQTSTPQNVAQYQKKYGGNLFTGW